jgi:predicted nucleic acid-binding protein
VRDYLLDTNIWSDWYNPRKNSYILKRLENEPNIRLHISVVTWGELRYGYEALTHREKSMLGNVWEFVRGQAPKTAEIDKHVAQDYGRLRAKLFDRYGPRNKKKKGLRPEQLRDPVTSLQLKIQENDLWIVSQAITRDFILVTNDRKSLQPLLEVAGDELHIEYWTTENI